MLKYFLSGFAIKFIASLDDFITRIPLVADLTKSRKGKIAFMLGNFLAVILIVAFSVSFAHFINSIPYINIISAGLILILALMIYFEIFKTPKETKFEKKIIKTKNISTQKFLRLIFIGCLVSLFTLIDDTLVFIGLFLKETTDLKIAAIIGILLATLIQLLITIYLSEKIASLKYKKEITTIGLIIISILIFFQLI